MGEEGTERAEMESQHERGRERERKAQWQAQQRANTGSNDDAQTPRRNETPSGSTVLQDVMV